MNEQAGAKRAIYRARVERIFDHASDIRSIFLRVTEGTLPRFVPGMFISIAIPLANETRSRPYTIATAPEDGEPFELCLNLVPGGAGSAWMFDRKVGDTIDFIGPFGAFTLDHAPAAETIFIAEGTGIAAIRPMLKRLMSAPLNYPVRLLYGADHSGHLIYRKELESIAAANPHFNLRTLAGDAGVDSVYQRLIETARREWVEADNDRTRQFYICGIGKGVIALRDLIRGAGYERRAVRYEQW
jgi:ferredoxin-NADP reductase